MNSSDSFSQSTPLENLRRIAEAETGMQLSGHKQARFSEALERVLENGQAVDIDGVLADPDRHNLLIERLTSALTIGESFFFRNEHHFRALREQVIPAVMKEHRQRREVRVWSAGCSTGEEPYSLAILLDQILKGTSGWTISILGTDINPRFLDRARQAVYRAWSFRRTNVHEDANYFTTNGDQYQLVSRVRHHVRFAYLNLVKDVYPSALTGTIGLDLILFRNVAIYLRPDIVEAILLRFHRALRPGGWLLLGEAEVPLAPRGHFEVVRFGGATFFRKPAGQATPPMADNFSATPILPTAIGWPPAAAEPSPWPGQETRPQPEQPETQPQPNTQPQPATRPQTISEAQSQSGLRDLARPSGEGRPQTGKEVPRVDDAGPAFEQLEAILLRGDIESAEKAVNAIRDRDQRAAARLACVRAVLATSGDLTRARGMLDRCLEDEPLLLEAELLRASLAEEDNHFDEAERAFRRALYIDRRCTVAHFQLALLQQQRGDADAARKSLQSVLNLAKSHAPDALVEHGDGVCYARLREMAQAMIDF